MSWTPGVVSAPLVRFQRRGSNPSSDDGNSFEYAAASHTRTRRPHKSTCRKSRCWRPSRQRNARL
eukprot:6327915-Prymnesium_polylepis.1